MSNLIITRMNLAENFVIKTLCDGLLIVLYKHGCYRCVRDCVIIYGTNGEALMYLNRRYLVYLLMHANDLGIEGDVHDFLMKLLSETNC